MTQLEAEGRMFEYLASMGFPEPLDIDRAATLERAYGWVFFYNTKQYLETGSLQDGLVGNAPVLVCHHGETVVLKTCEPVDVTLRAWEESRT